MSILSSADNVYALRFLRLLTMPWEKTAAFRVGLIDGDGNLLRSAETKEDKEAYTVFHRLVFNLRKLIEKVPAGARTISRYISALYLIRERFGVGEDEMKDALTDMIVDFESTLPLTEDEERLLIGSKVLIRGAVLSESYMSHIGEDGDVIRITSLRGHMFGLPIFEANHSLSGLNVFVTVDDIK